MNGQPFSPEEDEKLWGAWRWYCETGNGYPADWGAHMYDIVQAALGMDGLGPQTTMIVAAMPAPTMAVVLGSQYGGEEGEKFASQGVVWTTLAMFIVTPLLRVLIA